MTTPCLTCESALVRADADPPHDIDIVATTDALSSLVEAGRIREKRGDVPLADMLDLLHSEQKYTIVSYLDCLACGRTIFWGLCVRGAPVFRHVAAAEVSAHRWEDVPPREQWAGSRELDHQRSALRVIGHRPGAWFLLERGDGSLLLDARYSNGALIDGSVVLLLSDEERSAYRNEGDVFVNRLQELVHLQAPYLRTSPWHARNLSRLYGDAVDAAIADFRGDQSGVERAP
jgi:hypothetical protein